MTRVPFKTSGNNWNKALVKINLFLLVFFLGDIQVILLVSQAIIYTHQHTYTLLAHYLERHLGHKKCITEILLLKIHKYVSSLQDIPNSTFDHFWCKCSVLVTLHVSFIFSWAE